MSWKHYLTRSTDGLILRPLDIPSFSWSMTMSDFGFSTQAKNTGDADESSLAIPWTQFDQYDRDGQLIHQATPGELNNLIGPGRTGLLSTWAYDGYDNPMGAPIMLGTLGAPQDHWQDTTFPVLSPMSVLGRRYAIRDGAFQDGTSHDTVSFQNLSYRGLCAELGSIGTEQKNGGRLPIRWNYRGEKGTHQRTDYQAWNVQNLIVKQLLANIANCDDGPDMTFRPNYIDGSHVINDFTAAADDEIYLDITKPPITLACTPYGGSLELTSIDWALPTQRWYATGKGQGASVITAIAEDLSELTSSDNPPILLENAYSDTDATIDMIKKHAKALLSANLRLIAQLTGTIDLDDQRPDGQPARPLDQILPGRMANVNLKGARRLPDNTYPMRIMKLNGDQTSHANITFDVFAPQIK